MKGKGSAELATVTTDPATANEQQDDGWDEALAAFIDEIRSNAGPGFDDWFATVDAGNNGTLEGKELGQRLQTAASSVSPTTNIIEWRKVVAEMERWFVTEHNARLDRMKAIATEGNVHVDLREFYIKPSTWLRELAKEHFDGLREALEEAKDAMTKVADELYQSAGVTGFFRDIYRGFTTPGEGVKAFWGDDKWSKELQQYFFNCDAAIQRLGERQEELIDEITQAVVDRWNQESLATFDSALNKIDAVIDEEDAKEQLKADHIESSKVGVAFDSQDTEQPTRWSNRIFGFGLVSILLFFAGAVGWWLAKQ